MNTTAKPAAGASSTDASAPPPTPRRGAGRPFKPGNRANPGGRPKTDARLRAALERWSLEAARELRKLMRDPKTPRAVRARIAEYIVDRRLGRPTVAVGGADGAPLLSPDATDDNPLMQLLARVLERRTASAAGETASPDADGAAVRPPS